MINRPVIYSIYIYRIYLNMYSWTVLKGKHKKMSKTHKTNSPAWIHHKQFEGISLSCGINQGVKGFTPWFFHAFGLAKSLIKQNGEQNGKPK